MEAIKTDTELDSPFIDQGLTDEVAAQRLKEEGFNEIPSAERHSFWRLLIGFIREPMILLLLVSSLFYFFLGEISDAMILSFSIVIVISLTVYQERKTENALDALRNLSSPRARVIRSGRALRIPGREVARGDVMILAEGDRISADGIVLTSHNLLVNESLLTGESAPVRKVVGANDQIMLSPGGEDHPCVYSGTLVVQGQAYAKVLATARNTQLGQIGDILSVRDLKKTGLQTEINSLVKKVAVIALILCAVLTLIYGLIRHNWLNGILSGLTLSLSLLPEEFPTVLTVFLALGAWRVSRKNVLTRHIPAIEALGTVTVLCTDKTGTLTENSMRLRKLATPQGIIDLNDIVAEDLPEAFHEILEYGILASLKNPFDPMEMAIQEAGKHFLGKTEHIHEDWKLIHEYPLSPQLPAMSQVWISHRNSDSIIAAKGSPEAIADLCHLDEKTLAAVMQAASALAQQGLRVIGVAKSHRNSSELPKIQHDFPFEYLGLLGLEDPIRSGVPRAVSECHAAGIRILMITGDHPETAKSIGKQAGLPNTQCLLGSDIQKFSDREWQRQLEHVGIFARINPLQKLTLVNALKKSGELVAMTGDGVNDAPALKAAHIGIAMGKRGTDVAREAASLVLLDDDFSSIVAAIRMGRRIYDNLKKAMAYLLAVHLPIAGIAIFPILFGWPVILLPIHIVFLELIIDPVCSIVFELEEEEGNIMKRPPRSPTDKLLTKKNVLLSLLQGFGILTGMVLVCFYSLKKGDPANETRSLTFTTLIIANFFLIVVNRSWKQPFWKTLLHSKLLFWMITLAAFGLLGLSLFVPAVMKVFHFAPLHPTDYILSAFVGAASVLWFELIKIILYFKISRELQM